MDPSVKGQAALEVLEKELFAESFGAALWRVADLDMTEAEPVLLRLLDRKFGAPPKPRQGRSWWSRPPALRWLETAGRWQHAVVSALVRCGTAASIERLEQLIAEPRTEDNVRELARLAIVRIAPERALAMAQALLPSELASATRGVPEGAAARGVPTARGMPAELAGTAGELARATEALLSRHPIGARDPIVALYLLNTEVTRAVVFAVVRVAKLTVNAEASIMRTLIRLAELRRDGELFAAIARRIDDHVSPPPQWNGQRLTSGPFTPNTRAYFRRRVARVLRRLGRVGSPHYVPMAAEMLLAYSDADAQAPRHGGKHTSDWYDAFARYHVVNDLLYGQSPRYERANYAKSVWRCVGSYRPGGPVPAAREERFAELWDAAPDWLWRLVRDGRAKPVLEHATRALRGNQAYLATVSDEELGRTLGAGHPLAQRFAFEIARERPMSTALAAGALASEIEDAHEWVIEWVRAQPAAAIKEAYLIALLVTGKSARIREAAVGLVQGRAIDVSVARSAAIRAIAMLLGMADAAAERAMAAAQTILAVLGEPLREVSVEILRDLIERSKTLPAAGVLAGELMLRHARRDELPAELIEALLASPHAEVRTLGGKLLATMPADIAKDDPEALLAFSLSPNAELREQTRGLIGEVARRYPDVGTVIAGHLIDALMTRQPEGAPKHAVSLLRSELAGCLPRRPAATILKMIGALSPHAREAGGLLLSQVTPDDLGLDQLARLAHHEILAVRQGAWTLVRGSLDRYRLAPVAVSRLVDSPWEDTRSFAMEFIRDKLGPIPADAIIAICDSIQPEVQELGKTLLKEQFRTADAGRYLVRLAEHPAPKIQLLVSELIEHHLGDDPVRLERLNILAPYLIVVLTQVNRGRVAKERVVELLRRDATRSADYAQVIAPILARQSATIAITQKHPLIATMIDVRTTFPEIELPLAIKEVSPVRRRGGA